MVKTGFGLGTQMCRTILWPLLPPNVDFFHLLNVKQLSKGEYIMKYCDTLVVYGVNFHAQLLLDVQVYSKTFKSDSMTFKSGDYVWLRHSKPLRSRLNSMSSFKGQLNSLWWHDSPCLTEWTDDLKHKWKRVK